MTVFGEMERTAENGSPMNSTPGVTLNYRRVSVKVTSSTCTSNPLDFMQIPRQQNTPFPVVCSSNKTGNTRINVPLGLFAKSLLL